MTVDMPMSGRDVPVLTSDHWDDECGTIEALPMGLCACHTVSNLLRWPNDLADKDSPDVACLAQIWENPLLGKP